ncbi:alpha/beta fold hydrolase [Methylosinus sp. PW1]|uniref:alpha/beta fold hydrolase n=1 Tax=Methylosinus sp. PW1 TaxID=107636 RepID=UPI000A03E046
MSSKLETTASGSRTARRRRTNLQRKRPKLDDRLSRKPSSTRVTSQWKSRVKSRRKSTALALDRPVVAFDNAGVGRSTGETPDNVAAMARDAVTFLDLLGFSKVDLLGYSLGGCVAQQIAAEHGSLVRKLILVGTAPQGGEEHLLAVLEEAFSHTEAPDPRLPLFFTRSAASQAAGRAFLDRVYARKEDRDSDNGSAVTDPQAKALITWCATPDPGHALLRAIEQPSLVVSGSHDTMLPAGNAYAMFKAMSNAQLILYPDSGHGALFQHHSLFVSQARAFLDA